MIKKNLFKNASINLKYFKNNLIVKYKIIQKRREKGEKISPIDFAIEIGLLKEKSSKSNQKKHNHNAYYIDRNIEDKNELKTNKKALNKNIFNATSSIVGFVMVSFLLGSILFNGSSKITYMKITEENESKILNILKSPKTNTYINKAYNEKKQELEYFFLVEDNLDSYLYKIKFSDVTTDLKKELLQNNYKNTETVESLNKISVKTIIQYEDNYLINNQYNIKKDLVDKSSLIKIQNQIKDKSIVSYYNFKNIVITSITIVLSLILSLVYFSIKKVISRK